MGLGVVWFLGTKEGKKLKEDISERGEELLDSVKDQLDRAWREDYDPPPTLNNPFVAANWVRSLGNSVRLLKYQNPAKFAL